MATTNKGLEQPAINSTNWGGPLNNNFGYLDAALGGTTSKNVTGVPATNTLTVDEYRNLILNFTGTLTQNTTYQVPSGVCGEWIVSNATTGAFTLTVKSVDTGTSVIIPQNGRRIIYATSPSAGTVNFYTADNSVGSVGAAGNVSYSDGTGLTGSTGFTYNGTKVTVTATTAATNTDTEALRLDSQSSGTPAAGIGPMVAFAAETAAGVTKVGGQMAVVATDVATGTEDFDFVLRLMAAGAAASEVMRVTSTGLMTVGGNNVIAGRSATNTAVQSLSYAGITATTDDDGTFTAGTTYTPDPSGGNFKRIVNGGAFTLAAPTGSGDYTMVIQITNNASAGAVTFTGFNRVAGDSLTTINGNKFFVFITKCNGFKLASVQALQ